MEAMPMQPLRDLDGLVCSVEEASLAGRELSELELAQLERVSSAELSPAREGLAASRSLAHRIWTVFTTEGAAALAGAPEAKLRQLACDLFAAAARDLSSDERAMAAAQWALAGRAWTVIGTDEAAIRCFKAAAKPWAEVQVPGEQRKGLEPVAEAACQAQLWLGASLFRRGEHTEALAALGTARDVMAASQDLEDAMLDELLRTCYEQAVFHRGAGEPNLAVELLSLAAAALEPGLRASHWARLMRQLALCHADLGDREAALVHAREAVATAGQQEALSLQVLLRVLCCGSERSAAEEEELQRAALNLAGQGKVEDCLQSFAALPEESSQSCLKALSGRLRGDAGAMGEVLLFRLRLAVRRVEEAKEEDGDEAAQALLSEVVQEASALPGTSPRLASAVASALCNLGNTCCDAGRDASAAQWFQQAAPFLSSPAEAADCWATAAACLRRCGRTSEAQAAAASALELDRGHLQAALLQLLSLAEQPEGSSTEELRALLQRVAAHPSCTTSHAALAARALLGREGLAMAGLEALLARKPSSGGLRLVVEMLQRGADVEQQLDLAAELLRSREPCDELRSVVNAAWVKGQELGRAERWSSCASVFEGLQRLLEPLEAREVLEPRAWCLAAVASARLQATKGLLAEARGKLCEQALCCLERAHQLARRAARGGESRLFAVLVLLEFEARCLYGDSETQLRQFVDGASAQEAVGVRSLLAMAKIAAAVSRRRLAIHCLQRYLRAFLGARGPVDYAQCAAAYREMIALHASRNETFVVYEGILLLLSGGGEAGAGAEPAYPQEEVAWLVATAWNNGAHFYRLQQYRWGERWMGKALALAKFCIAGFLPLEEMRASHTECLKCCGD